MVTSTAPGGVDVAPRGARSDEDAIAEPAHAGLSRSTLSESIMVAFAALKHMYRKVEDRWVRKARPGPSDPQAARGPTTPKKSTDPHRLPTAGGKIARTVAEARRKAREAKREYARDYRRRKKRAA